MITKIIAEISCTLEEIQWETTLMLGAFELFGIPENIIKASEGTLIVSNYVHTHTKSFVNLQL